jgi:hypothetical protein
MSREVVGLTSTRVTLGTIDAMTMLTRLLSSQLMHGRRAMSSSITPASSYFRACD